MTLVGTTLSNSTLSFLSFDPLTANQSSPAAARVAPGPSLDSFEMLNAIFNINVTNNFSTSPTQAMPAPAPQLACAPRGLGLTKGADGTITTAGGYQIRAKGDAEWSITGPDGKELTRVWGDPHVEEGDGTRWDFSKASNFVLPDGTRIGVKTTGEEGATFSTGLDIANGNDRVQITGVDGQPRVGDVAGGGLQAWQDANAGRDTYQLRGDAAKQEWDRFDANGQSQGVMGEDGRRGPAEKHRRKGERHHRARERAATPSVPEAASVFAPPFPTSVPEGASVFAPPFPTGVPGAAQPAPEPIAGPLAQLLAVLGLGGFQDFGGLERLLGVGGFGGMGGCGVQPSEGLQRVALLQALIGAERRAQAAAQQQWEYARYATNLR